MKNDFFISKSPTKVPLPEVKWSEEEELPFKPAEEQMPIREGYEEVLEQAPQEFEKGRCLDPSDTAYGKGKCHQALFSDAYTISESSLDKQTPEAAFVILAEDELANFKEAMKSDNSTEWMKACWAKYETLMGYQTWSLVPRPLKTNIVGSRWTFWVKHDNLGNINKFKAWVVTQGFSQIPCVNFTETYSPMIDLMSIRFILAYTCQNDLEFKQVDIKGAYLNG